MKTKIYQIINFPAFYDKVKSQKLPFKIAYRLSLLASEIEKPINFYRQNYQKLLNEYGKKDEDGNFVPTSDGSGILLVEETAEEAQSKLHELTDLDIELPDIKFSIQDFDGIEITTEEAYIIMPFIED